MEDTSVIIRRVVNIQRHRTALEAVEATGRELFIDSLDVASMPVGKGPEEVELHYFFPCRSVGEAMSGEKLLQEYELRGLEPDPQAQAADNEAHPEFADDRPNGTHWKNEQGLWIRCSFDKEGHDDKRNKRRVYISSGGYPWLIYTWFAGVPKSSAT